MRIGSVPALAAGLLLLLAGCGSNTYDRAASGAGVGAASGAAIGAVFGGIGALPGAAVGAALGGATGAMTQPHQIDLGEPVWRR